MHDPARCPTDDQLEAFATGQSTPPDLQDHVAACAQCAHKIDQARGNNAFLDQLRSNYRQPSAPLSKPSSSAHASLPHHAREMPGYHTQSVIAAGGQGIVYKATHIATGRTVAIKMLNRKALASFRQRQRFEREIEIAAHLRHPNIVTLYETRLLDDQSVAFAMEFVDGLPLDQWRPATPATKKETLLTQRLALFLKICDAVQHAHQHGIIHRDLKPANILIDREDQPRILDFGVAKSVSDDSGVSLTGEFVGTLAYAAPEQVSRAQEHADTRTDVYALGLLLFQLLTGTHPYLIGGPMQAIIRNITDAKPTKPSSHDPTLGGEIDAILAKALTKDPDRRYQSVDALADDIRRFLDGDPIAAKHDSTLYVLRKTATRYRLPIAVVATFLIILIAFAATMTYQAAAIARERDRTAQALAISNIERARILAREGNVVEAEQLIHHAQHTLPPTTPPNPQRPTSSSNFLSNVPASLPHWALWDIYQHNPCLATAHTTPITESSITRIRSAPDGTILASCHEDGSINIWRLPTLQHLHTIRAHTGKAHDVLFNTDAPTITSIGADARIVTSDINSARTISTIQAADAWPGTATFTPSQSQFAATEPDGSVTLRALPSGTILARSATFEGAVTKIAIDDHAQLFAVYQVQPIDASMLERTDDTTLSHTRLVVTDPRNNTFPSAVSFGADKHIALGGFGAMILLARDQWRHPSPTHYIAGHDEGVYATAFNHDATRLASASSDLSIIIWDVQQRTPITTLQGHASTANHVLFSKDHRPSKSTDGNRPPEILVSANSHTIKAWELHPHLATAPIGGHTSTITWLGFTPDSETLVSSAYDGTIRTWNVNNRTLQATFHPDNHQEGINSAALSPDGTRIITSGHIRNRRIHAWNLDDQQHLWSSDQPLKGQVSWIEFSPDGNTVAAVGQREVSLHDAATGTRIDTPFQHLDNLHHLAFSPDSRTLMISDRSGPLTAINLDPPNTPLWTTNLPVHERCIATNPSATLIASAGSSAIIHLIDPRRGHILDTLEGHSGAIFAIDFSPDGTLLASGSRDGAIKLWDVENRRELITFTDHNPNHRNVGVFTLAFSPDGTLLASGGEDALIRITDLTYYNQHITGNPPHQND